MGQGLSQAQSRREISGFSISTAPQFGPLKILQFRTPTPQTEQMFEASFNATLDRYRELLTDVRENRLILPNDNFDVGENTGPGKYRLNDEAHAELLDKLTENKFANVSPPVKEELERFYDTPEAPYATKRNAKAWAKLQTQLAAIKISSLRCSWRCCPLSSARQISRAGFRVTVSYKLFSRPRKIICSFHPKNCN